MSKLIILGSAHSIPDEQHENTHMAFIGENRQVLIDCVGTPVVRLKQAGLALNDITDLILTHFHPDHVSGVPSLLMSMWLLGRRTALDIYGLHHTLDRIEQLMGFYNWAHWPNFFPVCFHRLPAEKQTTAMTFDDFEITTSPVEHLIPTIGLRIDNRHSGRSLVYSCDTEPCAAIEELARGVDILIHEATGAFQGHTHAAQAGKLAARAAVEALYLIHYNPQGESPLPAAQKEFPGPVHLAKDFMVLEF